MSRCQTCGMEKETRPYGPDGSAICVACAFSTPEMTRSTEAAMGAAMDACAVPLVDGHETGIRPLPGCQRTH